MAEVTFTQALSVTKEQLVGMNCARFLALILTVNQQKCADQLRYHGLGLALPNYST